MAVTAAAKTNSSSNANASLYATASVAFVANKLYLVWVSHSADVPSTVDGTGIAFTLVTSGQNIAPAPDRHMSLWRAMVGTDTTTALTIAFAGGQARCAWDVVEYDGVDTGGTNGSAAVVQALYGENGEVASTGFTVTLAAFGSADNATAGGFGHDTGELSTPGTGFTETTDAAGGEGQGHMTEFRADNDTTVDASWATSSQGFAIAVEVKAAAAAADARAEVSFAEFELPDLNGRAEVSFAEFELPSPDGRAEVSFAEFELPSLDGRAEVSFAEFELPTPARGEVSFAEVEVPDVAAIPGSQQSRHNKMSRTD